MLLSIGEVDLNAPRVVMNSPIAFSSVFRDIALPLRQANPFVRGTKSNCFDVLNENKKHKFVGAEAKKVTQDELTFFVLRQSKVPDSSYGQTSEELFATLTVTVRRKTSSGSFAFKSFATQV